MKSIYRPLSLLLLSSLAACGGGSSSDSDDGMLITGTLSQGATAAGHSLMLKHDAGEHIDEVSICALGECSTTDSEGQWGFVASPVFKGGLVEFSVNGHGIATTSVVDVPTDSREVSIAFVHSAGIVTAESMTADGAEVHIHEDGEVHVHTEGAEAEVDSDGTVAAESDGAEVHVHEDGEVHIHE
ncbi:MAG: hypothetical protein IT290_12815 [Deltaproteobacteria bacterium]|nr:hypothetical protein [Deltaproteobacteria bacterium]